MRPEGVVPFGEVGSGEPALILLHGLSKNRPERRFFRAIKLCDASIG